MSLQFFLGTSGVKKRQRFVEEIHSSLNENSQHQVFYLVPDHIKFQAEMSILAALEAQNKDTQKNKMTGMMRVQVFSFTRLAWYFLQDTDLYIRPQLTKAGLGMLVRKLLLDHEEELTIYRGEVRKSGFIAHLTDLLMELRVGTITREDLIQLTSGLGNTPKEADFKLKMQDIELIYGAYETALLGKYIEQEDILEALVAKINQLDLINTSVYVESYYRFNTQEKNVLQALMKKCQKVTISLTLNKGYPYAKPELHELFEAPGNTYYQLCQSALQEKVPILPDVLCSESHLVNELQTLEAFWIQSSDVLNQGNRGAFKLPEAQEQIKAWAAENKRAEVSHVAREIRRLISEEGYRYKDILVLVRNLADYENILAPIFEEQEIAYFDDGKEKMAHHPLVAFLQSLVNVKQGFWRYQDVMSLLRTELLVPQKEWTEAIANDRQLRVKAVNQQVKTFRENLDIAENVILAYGYEGYHWTKKQPWHYTRFVHTSDTEQQSDEDIQIEAIANQIKDFTTHQLTPLFKQWDQAKTVGEGATMLYQFLEKSGVKEQLAFWRDQEIERNHLEEAKKHEQTWDVFVQLLDEYVEVLGDLDFSLEAFADILMTGFEEATYGMVPPSIDQVILSNMEVARMGDTKVTFMLGVTDGNLPGKIENKSILTEEDRSLISETFKGEKYLKPSVDSRMASEPYMALLTFTASSEKLYLSYPLNGDGKEALKISPYLTRLIEGLDLQVEEKPEFSQLSNPLDYVSSKRSTLTQLLVAFRKKMDGDEIAPLWTSLYEALRQDEIVHDVMRTLFDSMGYLNQTVRLEPQLVTDLYGENLYTSVSRMENFYSCHFKHFAQYGLGLAERDVFELSPASTGELFHDALDGLLKEIIASGEDLARIDEAALYDLTENVLKGLYGQKKYDILNVSNRMNYIRYQLSQTIQRVGWVLAAQAKISGMRPVATEVLFGQIGAQKGMNGLEIPLNNGRQVLVRGKIDRVDQIVVEGQPYLSVLDYKSSAHHFDYRDAYYGLAMQMLTYLDTALQNAEKLIGVKAEGAGAFYLHVKNPILEQEKVKSSADIEAEMLKSFQLDGLLLKDDSLVHQLDASLEPKVSSLIYPVRETVSSGLTSSRFVNQRELQDLQQHNRHLFKEAGEAIFAGDVKLNPYYKDKQTRSCTHCPFHSVCQFDVMLKENDYHRLDKLDRNEVLFKINPDKEGSE